MSIVPGVRLVPLEDAHIARFLSLSDDAVLVATMGWTPFSPDEKPRFRQYLEKTTVPYIESARTITFSIVSAEDGVPAGFIALKGLRDHSSLGAEIALAIMDVRYRGRGLGTAALQMAIDYAFHSVGLALVALTVFRDNAGAIRSYEKTGFVRTELLVDSWKLPDGTLTDMWLMERYRVTGKRRAPECENPPLGREAQLHAPPQ